MATLFGIIIAVLITLASVSSSKKGEKVFPTLSSVGTGEGKKGKAKSYTKNRNSYPKYDESELNTDSQVMKENKVANKERIIDMKKAIIYSAILDRPYK
ncbi:MAG: hypothetical protein SPK52_02455 [Synergistales bacterium]|nr:hypothetical protein [Bacteroidales bacterium]MDY6402555.1 hypothetical protein [Bacteroidales bacterium]MDY6435055.1 hypothetical protein [Synergistales bacterium]